MFLGLGGTAALQAVYFLFVARALGAHDFGTFAGGLAFVSVLAPFAGFGAGNLLVMHTARAGDQFRKYFGAGLVAIGGSGALLAAACLLVGRSVFGDSPVWSVLPWLVASELLLARATDLVVHGYQAHERMRSAAMVMVGASGFRAVAAVAFGVFAKHPTASTWAAWYFGATAVTALVSVAAASYCFGRPSFGAEELRSIGRNGIFYAIGSSSQTVYADLDKAMLARLDTLTVTGLYTSAYRLVSMITMPVLAFVYAANPRFFRDGARDPAAVWRLATRVCRPAAVYGLVMGLVCVFAAPLLPHILGSSFGGATGMVRWLSLLPFIQAIHILYGNALMGVGKQALRSGVQVGTAVLNAGLNVLLIPRYSWRGAAVATLVGEALLAVSVIILLWRATRAQPETDPPVVMKERR